MMLLRGAVAWLALGGAVACETEERKATFTTRERSQAVETTSAAVTATASAARAADAPKPPTKQKVRRALCGGRLEVGTRLPKKRVSRLAAGNGPELPAQLTASKAGFTWVNFWAAWCAPCKEEIPRLKAWDKRLSGGKSKLRVAFISLDDDERQLKSFLDESAELRSTYWLKEGTERDEWLSAAGIGQDPELPIHLLVDSEGKIRCKVQGAVEDDDYPGLVRLLESDG